MELDLITAPNARKSDMADQPKLGKNPTPGAHSEAFTALVQSEPLKDPQSEQEPPALEGPQTLPLVLPDSVQNDGTEEVRNSEVMAPQLSDSLPIFVPEPPNNAGASPVGLPAWPPSEPAVPEVRIARVITPDADQPPTRPFGTESAPEFVKAPAQAALLPATPHASSTISGSTPPAPEQGGQQTAPTLPLLFGASVATDSPATSLHQKANSAAHKEDVAIIEKALRPVSIQSIPTQTIAPKIAASAPVLQAQFANVEHGQDSLTEVQFSIKMAGQSPEIAPLARAASAPHAPVATQISAQLPQLITKAEKQTIELRLDPPELGRITIHLTTNDTHVTAQVVAERVNTVDLMRQYADLLASTLARAGFTQADLSFQQGGGKNNHSDNQQFQSRVGETESEGLAPQAPAAIGQNGRLDIRL